LTYWIVEKKFQVSFGFMNISTIEIISRKYFQLGKIANRTNAIPSLTYEVMWCDVMWCDVMWCDVMWCDVMW
jgi:hypothetical protein